MKPQDVASSVIRKSQRAAKPSEKARDLDAGSKLTRMIKKNAEVSQDRDCSPSINRETTQTKATDQAKDVTTTPIATSPARSRSPDDSRPPPRPRLRLKYTPKRDDCNDTKQELRTPPTKRHKVLRSTRSTSTPKADPTSVPLNAQREQAESARDAEQGSEAFRSARSSGISNSGPSHGLHLNVSEQKTAFVASDKEDREQQAQTDQLSRTLPLPTEVTCDLSCLNETARLYAIAMVAASSSTEIETQQDLDAAMTLYCTCNMGKHFDQDMPSESSTNIRPDSAIDSDGDTIVVAHT